MTSSAEGVGHTDTTHNGLNTASLASRLLLRLPWLLNRSSGGSSGSEGFASPLGGSGTHTHTDMHGNVQMCGGGDAVECVGTGVGAPSPHTALVARHDEHKLQGRAAVMINLMTSIWGPTVFAMPWAFQQAGLVAGVVGILLIGAFSFTTLVLLTRAKHMQSPTKPPPPSTCPSSSTSPPYPRRSNNPYSYHYMYLQQQKHKQPSPRHSSSAPAVVGQQRGSDNHTHIHTHTTTSITKTTTTTHHPQTLPHPYSHSQGYPLSTAGANMHPPLPPPHHSHTSPTYTPVGLPLSTTSSDGTPRDLHLHPLLSHGQPPGSTTHTPNGPPYTPTPTPTYAHTHAHTVSDTHSCADVYTPLSGASTDKAQSDHLTYARIAARALGKRASHVVKIATTISCLGACAAYATFVAGLVVQVVPVRGLTQDHVFLGLLPVFVLLSWIRNFRHMALFNLLGNVCLLLGVSSVFIDGLLPNSSPSTPPPEPYIHGTTAPPLLSPDTALLFFGPVAFMFVIHYCAMPIESEMGDPSSFPPVLLASMAAAGTVDILVGVAGFLFYGDGPLVTGPDGQPLPGCERPVCDNVLKNIRPGPVKTVMFLAFSVNLVITYAIMLVPPREYLERWLVRRHRPLPVRWQRNALRTLLVLVTIGFAQAVKRFGLIIGFVGAITDTLQGFVLPPIIFWATKRAARHVEKLESCALLSLSCLGAALAIAGTYRNVLEIVKLWA